MTVYCTIYSQFSEPGGYRSSHMSTSSVMRSNLSFTEKKPRAAVWDPLTRELCPYKRKSGQLYAGLGEYADTNVYCNSTCISMNEGPCSINSGPFSEANICLSVKVKVSSGLMDSLMGHIKPEAKGTLTRTAVTPNRHRTLHISAAKYRDYCRLSAHYAGQWTNFSNLSGNNSIRQALVDIRVYGMSFFQFFGFVQNKGFFLVAVWPFLPTS